MAKIRMGYVGCGNMAQRVHIPNLKLLEEDCELVALAEVRQELGRKVRQRWNIPVLYSSHLELANDKAIDAVMISGSGFVQGDMAVDLLRGGKDVLIEKPLAISLKQAGVIAEAERETGKRVMVAYMKRYDAGHRLLKEKLDEYRASGELGKVKYIRNQAILGDYMAGIDTPYEETSEPYPAAEHDNWPDWLPEQYRMHYYGYLQQYTHNVNFLRWLCGADSRIELKSVHLDKQDGLSGIIVLAIDGILTTLESGNVNCHEWNEQTHVFLEQGWLKSTLPSLLLKNVPAKVEVYRGNERNRTHTEFFPGDGRSWMYKNEAKQFLDCLRDSKPFSESIADTMIDIRLLEEIYRMAVASWNN